MPTVRKIRVLWIIAVLTCVSPGYAQTSPSAPTKEAAPDANSDSWAAAEEQRAQGDIAMSREDQESAVARYTASIRLYPSIHVYEKRAVALTILNRLDEAIADYTAAIGSVRDPRQSIWHAYIWRAYNSRGKLYLEKNEYQKAIEDFSRGIALSGKDDDLLVQSYNNRTAAFVLNNQVDLGFKDAEAAVREIEEDPNTSIVGTNKAISYNNRGKTRFLQAQTVKETDRKLLELNAAEADANKAVEIAGSFGGGVSLFPRFFNNRADVLAAKARLFLVKAESEPGHAAQLRETAKDYCYMAVADFSKVLAIKEANDEKAAFPYVEVDRARAGKAAVMNLRSQL